MPKHAKEKFRTEKGVFDDFTERNLFKLNSQGYFEELIGPVALGKEANVFQALRKDGRKVIIKIYRLENCDFNKMYSMMKEDDRYQNIKRSKRNVIFAWTQREFRNLHKARDAGINVPTPLHFLHNILIEDFIGNDEPAPKLKDSRLQEPEIFFRKVVESTKKLYEGGLVHGDLSAFNILDWSKKPFFIDFSQATETKSPNAMDLLKRDVKNICAYFKKLGLKNDEELILKEIISGYQKNI